MTTIPQAGLYLFTYPTFAEKAQWIYVHFITPDQQHAFVTYPHHRYQKAGQLISVSWFDTVSMTAMAGHSPLMSFLNVTLPALVSAFGPKTETVDTLFGQFETYDVELLLAA